MEDIQQNAEEELIRQIWKILNEFRMNHFFTRPENLVNVGDFDKMMEQIQRKFLSFEGELEKHGKIICDSN